MQPPPHPLSIRRNPLSRVPSSHAMVLEAEAVVQESPSQLLLGRAEPNISR